MLIFAQLKKYLFGKPTVKVLKSCLNMIMVVFFYLELEDVNVALGGGAHTCLLLDQEKPGGAWWPVVETKHQFQSVGLSR